MNDLTRFVSVPKVTLSELEIGERFDADQAERERSNVEDQPGPFTLTSRRNYAGRHITISMDRDGEDVEWWSDTKVSRLPKREYHGTRKTGWPE